ncbi:MAG: metallophosphoesterase family protein [Methanoregula sp.]|nr:metallophosphoesterase family protein [Methanoregula sp.]
MSVLLIGIANDFLYIVLTGLGITLIAKLMRVFSRHESFTINRNFVFWICISTFSFWSVRLILSLIKLQNGPLYLILMGCGIFSISKIVQSIQFSALKSSINGNIQKREELKTKQNQISTPRETPNIYLISDLHLNHRNIIKYCHRPFSSVEEMNKEMARRWNRTVNKNDIVYFLGDLDTKDSIGYWIAHLNGRKTFIEGNHDVVKNKDGAVIYHKIKGAVPYETLNYRGYSFYLVHDPHEIPDHWKDWAIYGHKHNNDISKFPFIDGENKRINVSVEVIDFRPLNIDKLIELDLATIKRMDTIHSQPIRKS